MTSTRKRKSSANVEAGKTTKQCRNKEVAGNQDMIGNSKKNGRQKGRYRETDEIEDEVIPRNSDVEQAKEDGNDKGDDVVGQGGNVDVDEEESSSESEAEDENVGNADDLLQQALEKQRLENETLRKRLESEPMVPKVVGASDVSTCVSSSIGTPFSGVLSTSDRLLTEHENLAR